MSEMSPSSSGTSVKPRHFSFSFGAWLKASFSSLRSKLNSRIALAPKQLKDPYRFLVQGVRDCALVLLNPDGRVAIWNEGAERLQAYTSTEAVGVPYAFFFSNSDILAKRPDHLLQKAIQSGSAEDEGWRYRRDGTRFWAKVLVNSLWDEHGRLSGFSNVTYDISKQKDAEDQLKSAKESAEAANRAKTAFLANISHEIRTPLGAVLGFTELLEDPTISSPERGEFIASIQRNCHQLKNLISDILDLSKIEAERLDLEVIEFNLLTLLKDLSSAASAELVAKEKTVTFALKCAENMPTRVWSDPTRIRQVLTNLVGNAVKFSNRGCIVLSVSYEALSSDPNMGLLGFSVRDTGIGMSVEQQNKIFQPFSQADGSITRKYGGTGLGLVLSRQIAQLMSGDLILVESELDRGSEFKVSLKVHSAPPEVTVKPLLPATASFNRVQAHHNSYQKLTGMRILLVEDCLDNQFLMKRFLTLAEAQVGVANNGAEGVEMALRGDYDIILMDVQMPVLDGFQATLQLRQMNYTRPIIAVTANAFKEEREHCLRVGCDDHLAKPVSRASLLAKISQYRRSN
jgi:PAS domain S-box-containing protein